jgi:hypothetical protein
MSKPSLVASVQEDVDRLAVRAGGKLLIAETARQVFCRGHVGMRGVPADRPTEQNVCWLGRFARATGWQRWHSWERSAL